MLTVSLHPVRLRWVLRRLALRTKFKLGKDDEGAGVLDHLLADHAVRRRHGRRPALLGHGRAAHPLSPDRRIPEDPRQAAAALALFITNFHWGLHAWAIYAVTGLVIAYFGFRKAAARPGERTDRASRLRRGPWTRAVGWLSDLLAIVAIAIGLGGSIAMGVFQVKDGLDALFGLQDTGLGLALGIFVVLCLSYVLLPLMVDLGRGMALLSNTAMANVAGGLMIFMLLASGRPTSSWAASSSSLSANTWRRRPPRLPHLHLLRRHGSGNWFQSWTLTYMVWWLAWAPFVGVFIARISRGPHDPRVRLWRDPGARPPFRSSGSGSSAASASSAVLQNRYADPGVVQQQRQWRDLLRARLLPSRSWLTSRRGGRRGLPVHRHQRGQRRLRARHVFNRWRPRSRAR